LDQIRKMRLFVRVVETGSFSAASKAEGVAQSTVSKEVSSLEAHLGAQLIRRSSRGLSVTGHGREYYDFAVGMLADLDAAEAHIRAGDASPKGRIRVACAPVVASRLIAPALPDFLDRYPDLTIDLDVSERFVSLVEEGIDLAIRVGDLAASGLLARQIGAVEAVVVGAPAYFERNDIPGTPSELEKHVCLPFLFQGTSKNWKFRGSDGDITIVPSARLRTNDAESIQAAVRAGLGLAQGPSWIFAGDIAAGTLVQALADWRPRRFPIHAIRSGTRRVPGGIKLFVDYVAALVAGEPHLRIRP
jgi:LysR family transcriptional regulator, regulator for bpeEF and oprC